MEWVAGVGRAVRGVRRREAQLPAQRLEHGEQPVLEDSQLGLPVAFGIVALGVHDGVPLRDEPPGSARAVTHIPIII